MWGERERERARERERERKRERRGEREREREREQIEGPPEKKKREAASIFKRLALPSPTFPLPRLEGRGKGDRKKREKVGK